MIDIINENYIEIDLYTSIMNSNKNIIFSIHIYNNKLCLIILILYRYMKFILEFLNN